MAWSFLESLDSEHASSATSVKVKVPAMLIDAISFEESAATLTLTWSKNTRKVQVQGPLAMLDRAKEQLSNRKRATFVPQDPAFGAIVEQIATGGTCLLDRWPEWHRKCAEFMVHELGANEKTLEDIDLKGAPNSNGRFSKVDVTAENSILPDETPVLQYSLNVHP